MITKITAEFDSVEAAESAVRSIKSHADGFSDISLSAPPPDINENYVPFLFSMRTEANFTPNFLPAVFNNSEGIVFSYGNSEIGKPEVSRTAILEITCDKAVEHEIRSIISNCGGLKVNGQ